MKDMKYIGILEKVTVIIPAHNRPERLQRLLDYYDGTGINILVPDSSHIPFNGGLPSSRITYLHRPGLHFIRKIHEILPLIATPYVLYCAEDDFAVPEAIAEMVEFLEINPGYSVAQGHYLTFTPSRRKIDFYPRYIRNFSRCIDDDDPVARLYREKSIYASMLYGVTRTDLFKKIYSFCFTTGGELRFRNLFLAEEFFNHSMLILGKYATLPVFFSARERIKGSATETTVPVSEIRSSAEYEGFVEALSLLLAEVSGMELPDARKLMADVCRAPKAASGITFKRKVIAMFQRHKALHWAAELANRRYNQKGLRAVRGMQSYPCTFSTPEKEAIVSAVRSTRT